MFYNLLDLRSSECDVVSLYVVCCSVNVYVCFVRCVLDSVCELFGETKNVITSTNMTHNRCKAWKTIRKLSNDPTTSNPPCLVSANQVAHQLLVNGRGTMPSNTNRPVLPPETVGDYSMVYAFSEEEYRNGVTIMNNNKASGRDDVLVEQLKNIGPKSLR